MLIEVVKHVHDLEKRSQNIYLKITVENDYTYIQIVPYFLSELKNRKVTNITSREEVIQSYANSVVSDQPVHRTLKAESFTVRGEVNEIFTLHNIKPGGCICRNACLSVAYCII